MTIGVILATYSRPVKGVVVTPTATHHTSPTPTVQDKDDTSLYLFGVGLLVVSLMLSGALGTLQERIFQTYGPHWRESVFYTVCMTFYRCNHLI